MGGSYADVRMLRESLGGAYAKVVAALLDRRIRRRHVRRAAFVGVGAESWMRALLH